MEGAHVRGLEERDIDAAIALTDLEHWGYTRADFRRLLFLSPAGCFVAELGGRVVGVLTTTAYGRVAYLGAVIVLPELRGKGIGKAMMGVALERLRTEGIRTVRLYAYLNAISFYERLGFSGEYEVARWRGRVRGGLTRIARPLHRGDLDAIVAMDGRLFGADRYRLLDRLAEEFPSTFLVAKSRDTILGYVVGNPTGASCEVGPWIVEPGQGPIARDLLQGLVIAVGASEVAFSGPLPNKALMEFVRDAGFGEAFRALRMGWGANEYAGDPRGVWALAGLEKG